MSDHTAGNDQSGQTLLGRFVTDYGMVFVLLLLGVLFSMLTFTEQHPTGADAGVAVARVVANELGAGASVLIVTRDTAGDSAFNEAAAEHLEDHGVAVVARVQGSPADARAAIEAALASGNSIDAVIANNVTSKWTVYARYPEVGSEKVVKPEPYYWPTFLKSTNLLGVANQTAIYAIIAIGMTMVIITAGIDLSVGSLVALASVISAMLIRDLASGADTGAPAMALCCLAALLACALAGAFTGVMVTAFKIPPFIVTLAVMMMASGLAFRLSEGRSIPELPRSFFWLGSDSTLGIPNPVILMLGLYLLAHLVMTRMSFGRYVYAIGGNREAARLSGVPVVGVLLAVYTICGALAGLGGVMLASQLAAGDPKFGLMYELEVIAAVVVGGTSLMGGEGKIFGTLIGAFIIAVIKNGMNLTDVDPFNQKIVLGAVLLGAVLIDTLKRRC